LRICLDSSYLLPLFGIGLEGVPDDLLSRLSEKGHELLINEISIFECVAKAAKLVISGRLRLKRLTEGLLGAAYSPMLIRVSPYDLDTARLAMGVRRFLHDFIDCIILATAVMHADVLLTEDRLLLRPPDQLLRRIRAVNPELAIMSLRGYAERHGL